MAFVLLASFWRGFLKGYFDEAERSAYAAHLKKDVPSERLQKEDDVGCHLEAGSEDVKPNPVRVKAATDSLRAKTSIVEGLEPESAACIRPCPPDARPMIGNVMGHRLSYGTRWVKVQTQEDIKSDLRKLASAALRGDDACGCALELWSKWELPGMPPAPNGCKAPLLEKVQQEKTPEKLEKDDAAASIQRIRRLPTLLTTANPCIVKPVANALASACEDAAGAWILRKAPKPTQRADTLPYVFEDSDSDEELIPAVDSPRNGGDEDCDEELM